MCSNPGCNVINLLELTLTNHHLLLVTDVAVFVTSDLRNLDGGASSGDAVNWTLAMEYSAGCNIVVG